MESDYNILIKNYISVSISGYRIIVVIIMKLVKSMTIYF